VRYFQSKESANNAINTDVKKLRRSFLALQLFATGYGWRWATYSAAYGE
jgi:hypothetical protein